MVLAAKVYFFTLRISLRQPKDVFEECVTPHNLRRNLNYVKAAGNSINSSKDNTRRIETSVSLDSITNKLTNRAEDKLDQAPAYIHSEKLLFEKIDQLLEQRKEDSQVLERILEKVKLSESKLDKVSQLNIPSSQIIPKLSYSSKIKEKEYTAPTYTIPQRPVKTTLMPSNTVVISKNIAKCLSKGSSEIKKEFNKLFRQVPIEHCFASKGGSIFIEFKDETTANMVADPAVSFKVCNTIWGLYLYISRVT